MCRERIALAIFGMPFTQAGDQRLSSRTIHCALKKVVLQRQPRCAHMTAPGSTIQSQHSAQQSLQASKKNCIQAIAVTHVSGCRAIYTHLRSTFELLRCVFDVALLLGCELPCTANRNADRHALERPLLLQLPGSLRRDPLAPLLLLAREHELLFSHLRNGSTHLWPIQQRPAHQIDSGVHICVIHRPLEQCPPPLHRGCGRLLVPAAEHLKVIGLQGYRHILRTRRTSANKRVEIRLHSLYHGSGPMNGAPPPTTTPEGHCNLSCKIS
jgi:hypothetical protein